MDFISLCSGLGGFDWGVMLAGHNCIGYAECDTECKNCKTYTQHLNHLTKDFTTICSICGKEKSQPTHKSFSILHDPERRLWNAYDIRSVSDESIRELRERNGGIPLIVGGFPCQSFSIAGKREGFRDATRGTLFFEILRFASILRPQYLLLENVEGLLNHDNGETFETILGALDELGYGYEWQVHNSSTYVPQNRERVFVIGHLRGISTRKVFPFGRENSNSIEVIGRLEGKGDDYVRRVYGVGGLSPALPTMQGGMQEPKIIVSGHLEHYGNDQMNRVYDVNGLAPTLNARHSGNEPKVVVAGRLESSGGKAYDQEGVAPTQLAQHRNAVTKVIAEHKPTQFTLNGDGIAYCLDAGYQKGINDNPNIKSRRTMVVEEPRAILTPDRMEKHGIMITDAGQGRKLQVREDITPPLRAEGGGSTPGIWVPDKYRIRKLSPLECFRLQSYPDEWYVKLKLYNNPELIPLIDMTRNDITHQVLMLIGEKGIKEGMSDSQLYKMAGNGVTSFVAWDIARRLEEVGG